MQNRQPRAVWITDSDDDYSRTTARDWPLERNAKDGKVHAHLRLDADDIPAALDLRCLAGLECHIASDRGTERFSRVFDAVKEAGASVIVGVCDGEVKLHRERANAV